MELRLERRLLGATATLGQLFVNGWFECFTLEDTVRLPGAPKVDGATAIPPGRYRVEITLSARFKKLLPILVGVPGFEGIRIHAGNTAADTSGCILVGRVRGVEMILQSAVALESLQQQIQHALDAGELVWVTIY